MLTTSKQKSSNEVPSHAESCLLEDSTITEAVCTPNTIVMLGKIISLVWLVGVSMRMVSNIGSEGTHGESHGERKVRSFIHLLIC